MSRKPLCGYNIRLALFDDKNLVPLATLFKELFDGYVSHKKNELKKEGNRQSLFEVYANYPVVMYLQIPSLFAHKDKDILKYALLQATLSFHYCVEKTPTSQAWKRFIALSQNLKTTYNLMQIAAHREIQSFYKGKLDEKYSPVSKCILAGYILKNLSLFRRGFASKFCKAESMLIEPLVFGTSSAGDTWDFWKQFYKNTLMNPLAINKYVRAARIQERCNTKEAIDCCVAACVYSLCITRYHQSGDYISGDTATFGAPETVSGGAGREATDERNIQIGVTRFPVLDHQGIRTDIYTKSWITQVLMMPNNLILRRQLANVFKRYPGDASAALATALTQPVLSVTDGVWHFGRFQDKLIETATVDDIPLYATLKDTLFNASPQYDDVSSVARTILTTFDDYVKAKKNKFFEWNSRPNGSSAAYAVGTAGVVAPVITTLHLLLDEMVYLPFAAIASAATVWIESSDALEPQSQAYRQYTLLTLVRQLIKNAPLGSSGKTLLEKAFPGLDAIALNPARPMNEGDIVGGVLVNILQALAAEYRYRKSSQTNTQNMKGLGRIIEFFRQSLGLYEAIDKPSIGFKITTRAQLDALIEKFVGQHAVLFKEESRFSNQLILQIEGAYSAVMMKYYWEFEACSPSDVAADDTAASAVATEVRATGEGGEEEAKPDVIVEADKADKADKADTADKADEAPVVSRVPAGGAGRDTSEQTVTTLPVNMSRVLRNAEFPDEVCNRHKQTGWLAALFNDLDLYALREELCAAVLMSVRQVLGDKEERWPSTLQTVVTPLLAAILDLEQLESAQIPLFKIKPTQWTKGHARQLAVLDLFKAFFEQAEKVNTDILVDFKWRVNRIGLRTAPELLLRPLRHLDRDLFPEEGIGTLWDDVDGMSVYCLPKWDNRVHNTPLKIAVFTLYQFCFELVKAEASGDRFERTTIYEFVAALFEECDEHCSIAEKDKVHLVNFFRNHLYLGDMPDWPSTVSGCITVIRRRAYEEETFLSRPSYCAWSNAKSLCQTNAQQSLSMKRAAVLYQLYCARVNPDFSHLQGNIHHQIQYWEAIKFGDIKEANFEVYARALMRAIFNYNSAHHSASSLGLLSNYNAATERPAYTVSELIAFWVRNNKTNAEKFYSLFDRIISLDVTTLDFWKSIPGLSWVMCQLSWVSETIFNGQLRVYFGEGDDPYARVVGMGIGSSIDNHPVKSSEPLCLQTHFSLTRYVQTTTEHVIAYVDRALLPEVFKSNNQLTFQLFHLIHILSDSLFAWAKKYQHPATIKHEPAVVAAQNCLAVLNENVASPSFDVVRVALIRFLTCKSAPGSEVLQQHGAGENIRFNSIKGRFYQRAKERTMSTSTLQDIRDNGVYSLHDPLLKAVEMYESMTQHYYPRAYVFRDLVNVDHLRHQRLDDVKSAEYSKVVEGTEKTKWIDAHPGLNQCERDAIALPVVAKKNVSAVRFYCMMNSLDSPFPDIFSPLTRLFQRAHGRFHVPEGFKINLKKNLRLALCQWVSDKSDLIPIAFRNAATLRDQANVLRGGTFDYVSLLITLYRVLFEDNNRLIIGMQYTNSYAIALRDEENVRQQRLFKFYLRISKLAGLTIIEKKNLLHYFIETSATGPALFGAADPDEPISPSYINPSADCREAIKSGIETAFDQSAMLYKLSDFPSLEDQVSFLRGQVIFDERQMAWRDAFQYYQELVAMDETGLAIEDHRAFDGEGGVPMTVIASN